MAKEIKCEKGPEYSNIYEKLTYRWLNGCQELYDCSKCPYGEDGNDLCFQLTNFLCHLYSSKRFKERFENYVKRMLQESEKMPSPIIKEEVYQCSHCAYQETLTFIDGELQNTRKFEQIGNEIFHKCSDGKRLCSKIDL